MFPESWGLMMTSSTMEEESMPLILQQSQMEEHMAIQWQMVDSKDHSLLYQQILELLTCWILDPHHLNLQYHSVLPITVEEQWIFLTCWIMHPPNHQTMYRTSWVSILVDLQWRPHHKVRVHQ